MLGLLLSTAAVGVITRDAPVSDGIAEALEPAGAVGGWDRVPTGSLGAPGAQEIVAVAAVDDALVGVGIDARRMEPGRAFALPGVWRLVDGSWVPLLDAVIDDGGYEGGVLMTDVVAVPRAAGTRLIAVGYVNVEPETMPLAWTSDDGGDTWRLSEVGEAGAIAAIADVGGRVVAVGTAAANGRGARAAMWTSRDGLTWRRLPTAPLDIARFTDLAAYGTSLVAVAEPASLWQSGNGRTWNRTRLPPGAEGPTSLSTASEGFIAAAQDLVLESANGVTWDIAVPGALGVAGAYIDLAVRTHPGELLAAGTRDGQATLWRSGVAGPWDELALEARGVAAVSVMGEHVGGPFVLGAEMLEGDHDVAAWAPAPPPQRSPPHAPPADPIAVFLTREALTTVDLTSGAVRRVPNDSRGGWGPPLERDGRLVLRCGTNDACVTTADRLDAARLLGDAQEVVPSVEVDRVWLIEPAHSGPPTAREITVDGFETVSAAPLPEYAWPVGAVEQGLILDEGSGTLRLWSGDTEPVNVGHGHHVASGRDVLIATSAFYQSAVGTLVSSTLDDTTTIAAPVGETFGTWSAALAPDAQRLAVTLVPANVASGSPTGTEVTVALVDPTTGDVHPLDWQIDDEYGEFVWSPSGALLCAQPGADELACYDLASGTLRRYPVALRGQSQGFAILDRNP